MVQHIDEHDDDKPVGRVLSRREMLTLLGGASAALLVGAGFKGSNLNPVAAATEAATAAGTASALPACVVRPALTEGPYFVDQMLNRSDIRIEPTTKAVKPGAVLNLNFKVFDVSQNACAPLEGA